MEINNKEALVDLLLKIADDEFIIGHRISEWIGIGPTLEEDITFGSIAQDKVGHSQNMYELVAELTHTSPDDLAFKRPSTEFKSCELVVLPNEGYDKALVRHFLFDHAEFIRFELLMNSSYEKLSHLAKKFRSEIKYHIYHGNTWMKQLSSANEESKGKIQTQINELYPLTLGIFEKTPLESEIISSGYFAGEDELKSRYFAHVNELLTSYGLTYPSIDTNMEVNAGRNGIISAHLTPLISEMREVFDLESGVDW